MSKTANTITADYSLSPAQLKVALTSLVKSRQPVMIWGAPGVGKSQVAQQVARDLNATYIDVRALLLDPVDLRGIPWRDERDMTRWAPPSFLPDTSSQEKYIINLEELPAAPPMVQAALYQLVLDRQCGEYTLPENASIIACGNRETDRAVSHTMPTPLASRFTHLNVRTDANGWLDWANDNHLASEVVFFISMRPELLQQFDPKQKTQTFPCPRTWEFVSSYIQNGRAHDSDIERSIISGTVGEGAAVEFCAFLNVFEQIESPSKIIADPDNAKIPVNTSALIATCSALIAQVDEDNFEAVIKYALRLRREMTEFLVGACTKRHHELLETTAFIRYVMKLEKMSEQYG